MTTYTITSDTYWTPGASQGAGDGSTFADRQQFPTDIGILNINNTDAANPNTLYLVREATGHLIFATDVSTDDITSLGGLKTITDASHNDDPSITFTITIGGTTSSKGDRIHIFGFSNMTYCFIGIDTSGNQLVTGFILLYAVPMAFPRTTRMFRNCEIGNTLNADLFIIGTINFANCILQVGGAANDAFTLAGAPSIFLEDTTSSGDDDFGTGGGQGIHIFKYGTMTTNAFIDNFGGVGKLTVIRKAVFTVEDGATNPLADIEVYVTDGKGLFASKYITDSDGKALLANDAAPYQTIAGEVYVAVREITWYRINSGTTIQIDTEADGVTVALSDATDKATFIFRDPTGALETQVVEDAMAADISQTITMIPAVVPTDIMISDLVIPTGKTVGDDIDITFTTDQVITSGVVEVNLAGVGVIAVAVVPNGTSNAARIPAGILGAGTYDLVILVTNGSDLGEDATGTLTVDDPTRLFTTWIEGVRSVLQTSSLLDSVDDRDIVINDFTHQKADQRRPGIVIQPGFTKPPIFITTIKKDYRFEARILVSTQANWRGQKDDPDRHVIENLSDDIRRALEANSNLGGFLDFPFKILEIAPALVRNLNDANFYRVMEIQGRRLEDAGP